MIECLPAAKAAATPASGLKNLLLVTAGHSGASAIVPILRDVLAPRGVSVKYCLNETWHLIVDRQPSPFFHWTHEKWAVLRQYFDPDTLDIVFLHRDPRDVAVSIVMDKLRMRVMGADQPGTKECIGFVGLGQRVSANPEAAISRSMEIAALLHFIHAPVAAATIEHACDWIAVSEQRPVKVIRFDELKRDTVGVSLDVLERYGLPRTPELISTVETLYAEKYSFEAMVGRPRGSVGETHRSAFMVRKGISGEWRTKFTDELAALFHEKFGKGIERLGYEI